MKITLQKLNTKDLATLAQRIISSSKNGNYTVVENHELLLSIEEQYHIYDKVYAKLAFSGKGQTVAEADRTRDHLFSGIKKFLKGYEKLPSIDNYQIAMDVLSIFKTHGLDLDKLSYSAETAQMKKLIEELEKPETLTKLSTLNLETIFNQLKTAQTDFETIYAEQAEANADLRQLPSASAIRKNLEAALKNYLNLLTAMKNVENWKLIYADINEIVKAAKNSTLTVKNNNKQEGK